MRVSEAALEQLRLDPLNANRGTERGRAALKHSLATLGAGRSILLDRHNRLIAGNKTLQAAAELGHEELVIVESDGKRLVAVKRTDLDLDEPEARELAIADNRVGELDLEWDADAIAAQLDAGIDLSAYFTGDELEELLADGPEFPEYDEDSFAGVEGETSDVTFHVPLAHLTRIEAGIEATMSAAGIEKREKWRVLAHLLEAAGA